VHKECYSRLAFFQKLGSYRRWDGFGDAMV
jgi:hypothetical protein